MERTKKEKAASVEVPVDRRIRWKKEGGGSLRILGRMIKPGEIFKALPEDIPAAFRDVVRPLSAIPAKNAPPVKVTKSAYSVQPRGKSKSQFDVVDGNGKKMNDNVLTKELAEKLLADLSK